MTTKQRKLDSTLSLLSTEKLYPAETWDSLAIGVGNVGFGEIEELEREYLIFTGEYVLETPRHTSAHHF